MMDERDQLIDAAAADFVRHEPSSALQRRVMQRIDQGDRVEVEDGGLLRWALPIAAVMLLVIGFALRHPASSVESQPVAHVGADIELPSAFAEATADKQGPGPRSAPVRSVGRALPDPASADDRVQAVPAIAIDAVVPPPHVVAAPIAGPEPVQIEPLTIDPIAAN